LRETGEEVSVLQAELRANQPLLEQVFVLSIYRCLRTYRCKATKETEETMQKIQVDKLSADDTRNVVMFEEAEANKKAKETQVFRSMLHHSSV
jgi:hypothetical protein